MRQRRQPDNRYRQVIAATDEPEHQYEAALWRLHNGTATEVDEDVAYAHEIHSSYLERECLNAWILAGATNDEIHQYLSVPNDVSRAYRHLFFDLTLFRDQLDLMSWVSEITEDKTISIRGQELLRVAFDQGLEQLVWLYGRGQNTVDPTRVQQVLMTDAYHRARSQRGTKVSSREAAACNAFAKTALAVAVGLNDKAPGDNNQLLIKLKFNEQTLPLDELSSPENILH